MSKVVWKYESGDSFESFADNIIAPIYPWIYKDCCNILGESMSGKEILEIGGGPGHMAKEILSHPVSTLVELDLSSGMLKKSQKRNKENIHFAQATASNIPFKSHYFDVVFSRGSIMFWNDIPKSFSEIKRVLKSDGVAIIGGGYGMSTPSDIVDKVRAQHNNKSSIPKLNFLDIEQMLKVAGGISSIISKPKRGFWIKWQPNKQHRSSDI